MSEWSVRQLTFGTAEGRFHSHSYYDIPVIDPHGRQILAHRMQFAERDPTATDAIEIGIVDTGKPGSWTPVAETTAWSWQQGPMAQWIADGSRFVFNDREGDSFVARVVDADLSCTMTLQRPVYAVSPDGSFGLSLNMARLDELRPGYGYVGGAGARIDVRIPDDDGMWKLPMDGGEATLLVSLREAVRFLHKQLPWRNRARHAYERYHYWFNHVKISPNGQRFTVKLRWRRPDGPWNDRMGVSLTGSTNGGQLRLLANATSHVVWLNDKELYFWRAPNLLLYHDDAPRGRLKQIVAPEMISNNVHVRHLPPGAMDQMHEVVFDTPYRENIDVIILDVRSGRSEIVATFPAMFLITVAFGAICTRAPMPAATASL